VYKRRLDLLGQPLEEPQKEGIEGVIYFTMEASHTLTKFDCMFHDGLEFQI